MVFREGFGVMLLAGLIFSNFSEAAPLGSLANEASGGSFKYAWIKSNEDFNNREFPGCNELVEMGVIDEAEARMIMAYTYDIINRNENAFYKDLNTDLRDNNGGKYPMAKKVLTDAIAKLGKHQGVPRGPLYRGENSTIVQPIYEKAEKTGTGQLNQFTSMSIDESRARQFGNFLTTFLNPPTGANIEACSDYQPEREVLLPVGVKYTVTSVASFDATLTLQKGVATTTTTAEPKSSSCFPAGTKLLTRNHGVKYIEDLQIGDEVQVISPDGSVGYSEVWCHGHYDLKSTNIYLEITTQTHVLPISHRHYLPVASNSTIIYKMAQDVQVGDFLMTIGGDRQLIEIVQHVTKIERKGAFSPFTKFGQILVNGIQASCYSEVYPTTAHVGLAPFRVAYDVTPRAIMDLILAPNSDGVPFVFDAILNTMSPFIAQGSAGTKETHGLSNLFRPCIHPVS